MSIDTIRPTLSAAGNNAAGVSVSAPIEFTFSEAVVAGTGYITITDGFSQVYRGRDGLMHTRIVGDSDTRILSISDPQVSITGDKIVVTLSTPLAVSTSYHVMIDQGFVRDSSGNIFAGIGNTSYRAFTTGSTPPAGPTATVNADISFDNDDGKSGTDGYVSDATQIVSGTFSGALGSNTVEVSVDGGNNWHTATVSGSSWSYSATLEEGTWNVLARVSDGTLHSAERSREYTLDLQAPSVSSSFGITLDLKAECDQGSSSSDNLTNEVTPTVRINVASGVQGLQRGDTIEIIDSNHGNTVLGYYTIESTDIDSYGHLLGGYRDVALDDSSLADGTHALKARVGDLAGHTPTAAGPALNVTIDTSAVALSSATPSSGSTAVGTNLAKITLQFGEDMDIRLATAFTLVDDGNSDSRDFDGESLPANFHYNSTTHKLDIFVTSALLSSTHYTLKAAGQLTDAAGNVLWNSGDSVLGFTTTGGGAIVSDPTMSFTDTGLSSSDGITSDHVFDIGLPGGAAWRYSVDGGSNWTWVLDGSTTLDLADGSYAVGKIQIQQVTAANQYSAVISNTQAITIDTTAPSAVIDYAGIPSFLGTGTPVAITDILLTGTLSGADVQYTLDHGASWATATPNAGHDSWGFNATFSAGGYVGLRVADSAGNVAGSTGVTGVSGAHTVYVGDSAGGFNFISDSNTVLFGNGGDDIVSTATGQFLYLNGGAGGNDQLRITGDSLALDAAALAGELVGFERIHLGNNNSLKIQSAADLMAIAGGSELFIDGNITDHVDLGTGNWNYTIDLLHPTYLTLQAGGATLHIDALVGLIGSYLGGL